MTTTFSRVETCRKCESRILAVYALEPCGGGGLEVLGWGGHAIGRCGNPDRCCDKLDYANLDRAIAALAHVEGAA